MRFPAHHQNSRGFTLIEMAIVLVVIGLVVGGIVVGQSLIRQSQITSVMTDEQTYVRAVKAFAEKYGALPGDMPNATSYWSGATNGTGDGQIANSSNEQFGVWQQLALAGYIPGSYTGLAGPGGGNDSIPGTNVPASRLEGGGFGLRWVGISSGVSGWFDGSYGHALFFGARVTGGNPKGPILTTAEAASIDAKYDDGLPGTGIVRAYTTANANTPNCATSAVSATAAYNSAVSGRQCSFLFITGF